MSEWRESLLWRWFPSVRTSERGRFLFFFALSALISAGQTIGLCGTEALYLVRIGPEQLPLAFVIASLVTVAGSLVYAYWVGQLRNDRFFVFLLGGSAIALEGAAIFVRQDLPWLVGALFCAFYLLQAVFVNLHFWTFAADYFDTLASKRLFPLFALGASVGGVIGGLLAAGLSGWLGAEALIAAWAGPLLAAAVLIYAARGSLVRWSPVTVDEADESSTEAMRGALRYLRRSSLARWLVASVLGLVVSMVLIQFVYLDIFSKTFPNAETLAVFLGIYLAVSNALEIGVALGLTQWLIPRFGVVRAGLLHPVFTLLTFGALILDPRIHVAVLARANRELLENALAAPLRSLTYNAISFRFRGRMRAFLEGIVFNAGMALAGVVLILIGGAIDLGQLCAIGAGAAFVYLLASLGVRREYLKSLVAELRAGRLDLRNVRAEMGAAELHGIANQWEALALDESERPTSVLLQLAPLFAEHGLIKHLEAAARSPHPRVRSACLEALAGQSHEISEDLLTASLRDVHTGVRLSAAAAAGSSPSRTAMLEDALRERLADEHPAVRAEAAVHCQADGLVTLRAMAGDPDPRVASEALERLPISLVDAAQQRLQDADPGVRAAALRCWSRLQPDIPLAANHLIDDLRHSDARVRRAAAQTLGALGEEQHASALADALDDGAREVRQEAASALAAMGDSGLRAAEPLLGGMRRWTVDAALTSIARVGTQSARAVLERAYRDNVLKAWKLMLELNAIPNDNDLESSFLRLALGNAMARCHWFAFRALELLEDPAVVRSVQRALRQESARGRADALEVLSHLADREASTLLALLLEQGPLEEKLPALKRAVAAPLDTTQVVSQAATSQDRWLRMAAERILSQPGESAREEERLMEGLLALRKVPLFSHLSLEQLETISQLMHPVEYLAGEIMMRQGDPGEELYVLLEGEARAYRNYGTDSQIYLSTMRPVSYIGEVAILDQAARSATVLVTEDARLLTLGAEPFRELILQTPEMSFEVFRVLTERIRQAERRDTEP